MASKLTPKQERFCQEYIVDLNATQAAIRAGYSRRSAEVTGSNLLRNPKVAEKLSKLRAEQEKRTEITTDAIVKRLAEIGFADPAALEGFKGSDVVKSLELLGKHKGMFKELHEHTGKDGGPIQAQSVLPDLANMTPDELMLYLQMTEKARASVSSP